MRKEIYYVKSLEEDLVTKTLKGHEKVSFQSIENIIKTKKIKPNTKSFGRQKRLSCTIIDENYLKTYRPQGIIFKTKQKPNYVLPFDVVLLSANDNIIVQYYRIKNKLHIYYNYNLIPGFERFIFKDFQKLKEKFPTLQKVWDEINNFRISKGYKPLKREKHRLVEYDEAAFHKTVKIEPVAIFGYRKNARKVAKKLKIPFYISTKKFYENIIKKEKI